MSSQAHDALVSGQTHTERLGYRFANPELLSEALTHRSALSARGASGRPRGAGSNERLEFIGDRVLGLVIAEWLAERFPDEQEGALGRRLGYLVAQPALAAIAEQIGLAGMISAAPGDAKAGVKMLATVLSDAMEAVIGAIYLDGGLAPARDFVRRAWAGTVDGQLAPPKDPKTALQEWALGRGLPLPTYRIVELTGPSHAPHFTIEASVLPRTGAQSATGSGTAKRAAEQEAARALLTILGTS